MVFRKSKVFYFKLISFLFIFCIGLQDVQAAESPITINAIQDKYTGESVTVTGSAAAEEEIMVKVFQPNGQLYFFSMASRLSIGIYSASYKIPTHAPLGRYTVVAGHDNVVSKTTFIVKSAIMRDIEAVLNNIQITYASGDTWESVTQNIRMPLTGSNGTTVAWSANKPEFIRVSGDTGIITRPGAAESDVTVTLTATVSKDGQTASRPFLIIVKKQGVAIERETQRQVNVVIGDGNSNSTPAETVDITRKHLSDGTKIDKVVFDDQKAQNVVESAINNNKTTAQIIIDDLPNDQADEIAVEIPNTSIDQLATTDMDLDIKTEAVTISLEKESLRDLKSEGIDLFFRVVPIRKAEELKEVEDRTKNDTAVKEKAGNLKVEVLGKSLTIETNYKDFRTKLRFPLTGITLPTDATQLQQFLHSIHVFIEHSDGEKKVVTGTPVYENGNPIAIEIEIDKFSTFTLIQVNNPPSNDSSTSENENQRMSPPQDPETKLDYHERLIHGYPNQTFRPSRLITRAEIASLIARIIPAESEGERSEEKYPDVSSTFWAAKDIDKVKTSQIMKGDQQGRFRPNDPVTRAEMAAIVVNWKQLNMAGKPADFKDTQGHWADHVIQAVKSVGVMTGYPDGTFRPNQELTRAEAVVVLNQLLNRGPLKGVKTATWPDVPLDHWASADVEEASTNHHYSKENDGGEFLADR